jgi:hypothetical protein
MIISVPSPMKNPEYLSEQELLVKLLTEVKEIKEKLHNNNKPDFGFVDNADLVQILKVNPRTLANWRKDGVLKHIRMGGKIYYNLADIKGMMEEKFNKRVEI